VSYAGNGTAGIQNTTAPTGFFFQMPKQEPVAWVDIDENGAMSSLRYWSEPDNRNEVALYPAPRAAVVNQQLTTEPAAPLQEPPPECQTEAEKRAYAFWWWKALEANRAAPVQEPVALVIDGVLVKSSLPEKYTGHLYTTPPAQEFVCSTGLCHYKAQRQCEDEK
jgi:hypothetical protein